MIDEAGIPNAQDDSTPDEPLKTRATQLNEDWVHVLTTSNLAQTRLEAIGHLTQRHSIDAEVLNIVEQTAINDPNADVRQAALIALAAPPFRAVQQSQSRLTKVTRRFISLEIEQWAKEGLISQPLMAVLRHRYDFDLSLPTASSSSVAAAQAPVVEAKPPRSLSEILLGETAIKTALYLGAFFVIAAACFFATAVEQLRLPILGLATFGFLTAAVTLKHRLPQASFIFAIIFSFLIAINGVVFQALYPVIEENSLIFWVGVSALLGFIWLGGTWFYQSRIFSVLSLLGFSSAAFLLGRWFDQEPHLDLILLALTSLLGLGGVVGLRRWQNELFSRPLFWSTQFLQLLILATSVTLWAVDGFFDTSISGIWWTVAAFTWLLAVGFYLWSDRLQPLWPFQVLAVVTLLPIPLLLTNSFSPSISLLLSVGWVWGAILALISEVVHKWPRLRFYSLLLLGASGLLFLGVAVLGLDESTGLGITYLVGIAVVYVGLAYVRPRSYVFGTGVFAAAIAYFALFELRPLADLDLFPGFITLWPAFILLGGYLLTRKMMKASPDWFLPLLILGVLVGVLNIGLSAVLVLDVVDQSLRVGLIFGLWAIFALIFSLVEWQPRLGYGVTLSLFLAMVFTSLYFEQGGWVLPFVGLASLYYLGGFALRYLNQFFEWADMLRWSGLGLGALVSLTAPLQDGASPIVGVAIVAFYFTVEAFLRRNVWLGFPANILYFLAYALALIQLDVSEPQFYSIGAALLGIIMHYLLVSRGSKVGAFITGLIAQLILLSTTYIQMLSTERLLFFVVLFFQALVMLAYGLVVRSRSFFIVPIVFLVVGVISITFTILAGIPTIILIGCTGLLLLGLGVLALVMRERLIELTDQLGDKLGGWRA